VPGEPGITGASAVDDGIVFDIGSREVHPSGCWGNKASGGRTELELRSQKRDPGHPAINAGHANSKISIRSTSFP